MGSDQISAGDSGCYCEGEAVPPATDITCNSFALINSHGLLIVLCEMRSAAQAEHKHQMF